MECWACRKSYPDADTWLGHACPKPADWRYELKTYLWAEIANRAEALSLPTPEIRELVRLKFRHGPDHDAALRQLGAVLLALESGEAKTVAEALSVRAVVERLREENKRLRHLAFWTHLEVQAVAHRLRAVGAPEVLGERLDKVLAELETADKTEAL
jgi:hypothetical protein